MDIKYHFLIASALFISGCLSSYYLIKNHKTMNLDYDSSESLNLLKQLSKRYEKIDLGFNPDTNESLWKYPNETEWRSLDG